ncbi:MAG: magnesium transporter [Acidobacteria bacterium SCN 69-37]|nr:MAG: magnesium transporter [Acidobacteria bacterium SCN 69-37]
MAIPSPLKHDLVPHTVIRLLAAGATDHVVKLLQKQHPADIARILQRIPDRHRRPTFDLLVGHNRTLAMQALAELAPTLGASLLEDRAADEVARLLETLPADDAAPILERLPDDLSTRARDAMSRRGGADRLLQQGDRTAGRIMNPDVFALPETTTAGDAVAALQRSAGQQAEMVFYLYVTDRDGHLVGVTSLRRLLVVPPDTPIHRIMTSDVVRIGEDEDQQEAARLVASYNLLAVPVVDGHNKLVGSITVDDVIDVMDDRTTKDIQKLGGLEALDEPYTQTPFGTLVKKRARWLIVLFIGEMLTATAMAYYEEEIASAVVLALFVPLIISSGGNSGSQAASLMIRALAVGELTLRDWWRVMHREVLSGLALGSILGAIGFARVAVWGRVFGAYGEHSLLVALTVGFSLVGVVLWGTVSGSMLPFIMKRLGADPATSSAPFVATLVDVTGLVIYFTVAALLLQGTLL